MVSQPNGILTNILIAGKLLVATTSAADQLHKPVNHPPKAQRLNMAHAVAEGATTAQRRVPVLVQVAVAMRTTTRLTTMRLNCHCLPHGVCLIISRIYNVFSLRMYHRHSPFVARTAFSARK